MRHSLCFLFSLAATSGVAQSIPGLRPDVILAPDYFTAVRAVAISKAGMVAVADPSERSIMVFSASGDHLWDVGGRGLGPGELEQIMSIGWLADTLWVSDSRVGRVTRFRDGRVVSAVRYEGPALAEGYSARAPYSIREDGSEIVVPSPNPSLMADGSITQIPVITVGPTGDVSLLSTRQHPKMMLLVRSEGRQFMALQPYANFTDFAVSPAGTFVAFGDARVVGGRGLLTVTIVRSAHDTLWTRTTDFSPIRPPNKSIDRVVDSILVQARAMLGKSAPTDQIREAVVIPEYLPAVTAVVAGEDGSVWIRREDDAVSETLRWEYFDKRGTPGQSLTLPREMMLMAAMGTQIWTVTTAAEDGVPTVGRYLWQQ